MSFVNIIVTLINSRFLLKITHKKKIILTLILSTLAYLLLGLSNLLETKAGLVLALVGTFIMGLGFTIGEITMLGKIKF